MVETGAGASSQVACSSEQATRRLPLSLDTIGQCTDVLKAPSLLNNIVISEGYKHVINKREKSLLRK